MLQASTDREATLRVSIFLQQKSPPNASELLRELLPKATQTVLLVNPDAPLSEAERERVEAAARTVGHEVLSLDANSAGDIETAFATMVQHRANALLLTVDSFFLRQRGQIAELAARFNIPTVGCAWAPPRFYTAKTQRRPGASPVTHARVARLNRALALWARLRSG
jgi:hypothetical protein